MLSTCTDRGKKKDEGGKASFPEKGVAGDAVQQVIRLSFWGLGQCKDLLLRHTGWNGDVTLVKWVKVLVWWDRTGVTNRFDLPVFASSGVDNGLFSLFFTDLHSHLLVLLDSVSLLGKGL